MAQTIKLRRSAVQGSVPTTAQLALGELAINTYDGKLFLKKDVSGTETIVEVGTGGGASLTANNAFTGANTFTNTTGQIFRQANTQDGILLRGRGGGTSSWLAEITTAPLSSSVTYTFPPTTGTVMLLQTNETVSGAKTFANPLGLVTVQSSALEDGIRLLGRGAGTNSRRATITCAVLTNNRTLTLPDVTGTVITTGDTGTVTSTMIENGTILDEDVNASAAIAGTKINANFGTQTIQSNANPGLSLTGVPSASGVTQGVLSQGTLSFTAPRILGNFAEESAQYIQVLIQNKSTATNASCDFVVCNDSSTDTSTYGNLGINSSTYSGTGVFNQPNTVYLTSNAGPLGIGTITPNDIRFSYNGEATDALTIGATAATFGKSILLKTGTATDAPLDFTSGTLLTTPAAGAVEYLDSHFYSTPTTTSGRGFIPSLQTFRLTANGSNVGPTIGDFFGANSSINLAATSVYDIEAMVYLQKNTAGTLTWTWTASSAPTLITSMLWAGPVTGIAAGTPTTLYTGSRGATTAAFGATGSISNNAFMAYQFKTQVITNLATNFKLRITCSAGTVTPQAGSFYTVTQISPTTGSFAA